MKLNLLLIYKYMSNISLVKYLRIHGLRILALVAILGVGTIVLSGCTLNQDVVTPIVIQPVSQIIKTAYVPLTANEVQPFSLTLLTASTVSFKR